MRAFLFPLSTAILALTLSPGAYAQSGDMQARLERAERDLAALQRVVYQGQNPPPAALDAGRVPDDVEQRLNDMQSAIQGLTGQVESINNRLIQLERGGVAAATPAASALPAGATGAPPTPPQPIASGNVPGVSMPLPPTPGTEPAPLSGSTINGVVPGTTAAVPATGGTPGVPAGATTPTPPTTADTGLLKTGSHAAYSQGFAMMQQGDYVGAEAAFKNFLRDYPSDTLSGNAQYWLGESYYARKDYTNSATTFLTVYQKYPKNSKAADALLKLGLSLSSLGNTDQACQTFKRMRKEYPSAAPALVSRAKTEEGKLRCK